MLSDNQESPAPNAFDVDAFIQGPSITGYVNENPPDHCGGVIRIESLGIKERPYLGLRDVFRARGDPKDVADALQECERSNAWPDWVAYFRAGEQLGWEIGHTIALVSEAIAAAKWEQTLGEVLQEVSCRNRNVFVQQNPLRPLTIDSGLELVSP